MEKRMDVSLGKRLIDEMIALRVQEGVVTTLQKEVANLKAAAINGEYGGRELMIDGKRQVLLRVEYFFLDDQVNITLVLGYQADEVVKNRDELTDVERKLLDDYDQCYDELTHFFDFYDGGRAIKAAKELSNLRHIDLTHERVFDFALSEMTEEGFYDEAGIVL